MSTWTSAAVAAALRARYQPPADQDRDVQAAKVNNGEIATLATSATHTAEADAASPPFAANRWLEWLDPDDARIVEARAAGAPWKLICWRFGISRATADRRWRYALSLVAWRLNHPDAPFRLSRRQLMRDLGIRACETSAMATGAAVRTRSGAAKTSTAGEQSDP